MVDGDQRCGELERAEVVDSIHTPDMLYVTADGGNGTRRRGGSRPRLGSDVLASWAEMRRIVT